MPFVTSIKNFNYGTATYSSKPITYCQNNTSASDYGKCYNIIQGRAVFVQTDTTTYPVGSLPCEVDNTCIRYTSTSSGRLFDTVFSYTGKQAILQYFWARSHSSFNFVGNILYLITTVVPITPGVYPSILWMFPAINYEVSSWPVYDPVENWKAYLNPYTIPVGYVNILRWHGNVFTSSATLSVYESNNNNIWYAFDVAVSWAYESSPLAIIPLDYGRDYVPFRELRSTFGYAANGVDQPGWNADDMIRVLKDIFPDRAWAVYDDKQYVLYLYNLTIDYVPDWLIDKLAPVEIKVLQPPSNLSTAQAWLNELNARNRQAGGP